MIDLVCHSEMWGEKFLTLKSTLLSFDGVFMDIQHIGSTSIKGVKAKDIIDIQCGVKSFNNMNQIRETLESLGFIYSKDFIQDHVPFEEMDCVKSAWEKRFFSGKYQGQSYNIHIRVYDSLNWIFALNFRDFLTSNDKARYAFMQFKERLASTTQDLKSYCIVKDSVIDLLSLQFNQ
jgi:dephospho-CoA kinase